MAVGFASLNTFKRNARRLAQLYDFTAALYLEEVPRLRNALKGAKPGQSLHTRLGTITHSLNALYDYAKKQFPDRLRSLILISLVAQFEAFLTDLVAEIAERDLSPFADSHPLEIPRGRILTATSISALQDYIIDRDRRQLTSGGLDEIGKYFKRRFDIDFNALSAPFAPIKELHARRHLHVHSDGVVDHQYVREFPNSPVTLGQRLEVGHDYLLNAFSISVSFASAVTASAVKSFPKQVRLVKSEPGSLRLPSEGYLVTLDVDMSPQPTAAQLLRTVLQAKGSFRGGVLADHVYRVLCEDRTATLVIGATEPQFRGIIGALKQVKGLVVRGACSI